MSDAGREFWDVAIIGAGAAGLATAIFAARERAGLRILALDGAARLGAKILVAGGGRCNVTNVEVSAADYNGGSRRVVQRVLERLPVGETVDFFREIGVELHREPNGKLFPNTNQARTVLNALIEEARRRGVVLRTGCKVVRVERCAAGFAVAYGEAGAERVIEARAVVLATGGLSLPKTGSDGSGYGIVEGLGHTLTPRTPGLAPLVLEGEFHRGLSGVAQEVELTLRAESRMKNMADGGRQRRLPHSVVVRGAMLWTHFGVSGPAALDISRHWLRAKLDGEVATLRANFRPGCSAEMLEKELQERAVAQPRATLRRVLAEWMPERLADALLAFAGVAGETALAHLAREARRATAQAVTGFELPVRDSRGYGYAEVTAGGVPLEEIDAQTMESRKCAGLFLVGEILAVDGRIGGFNFQWAWSGARVAGAGLARYLA